MSQQQKLEKVLDLLLSEDSDQAAELLHQIIVEKARTIYESIVDEEVTEVAESDEVGGEPSEDFTDEIASDESEVESDEENDGEASSDDEDDFGGEEGGEGTTEERVEDLESQLAELRAEFDALMGEEMQEPEHMGDPLDGEVAGGDEVAPEADAGGMPDFAAGGAEEKVVGEVVATMFEKQAKGKLAVAPQAKKQGNKVAEETKFLNKTPDTGQRGTAKLVGTGKNTPLGAEQDQSSFTKIPPRVNYGGTPKNILGGGPTGGEYGKYNGDSASDDTPSDNVNVDPKKNSVKATTEPKWTGGKSSSAGEFNKSPLTKKPA
jgi:hypothetical protein